MPADYDWLNNPIHHRNQAFAEALALLFEEYPAHFPDDRRSIMLHYATYGWLSDVRRAAPYVGVPEERITALMTLIYE